MSAATTGWRRVRPGNLPGVTVTGKLSDDDDDETVSLAHTVTSGDPDYDGVSVNPVAMTVANMAGLAVSAAKYEADGRGRGERGIYGSVDLAAGGTLVGLRIPEKDSVIVFPRRYYPTGAGWSDGRQEGTSIPGNAGVSPASSQHRCFV